MPVALSANLADPLAVPYFLWDEPITVMALRERLRTASRSEATRLLGKILREARDTEVWLFTTPAEIALHWGELVPHLGRRRPFWEFLLQQWREEGFLERAPQGQQPKMEFGSVRVDPPDEILANKLCTLISRAEIRDLVDVLALEKAGHRAEEALPLAMRKDGGLTPAQLAWVLSQIAIGDDARIPGSLSIAEVRAFVANLIARLTRLAFPGIRRRDQPC